MNISVHVSVSSSFNVKNEWAAVTTDSTKMAHFGNTRSKARGLVCQ